MASALRLALSLAWSPAGAFPSFKRPGASLRESLIIYGVFLLVYAAFFAHKPPDFPSAMENAGLGPRGFGFWLQSGLVSTFLYAVWFGALAAFLNLGREGRLFFRTLLQLLWVALAAAFMALHVKGRMPLPLFAAAWLAAAAPGVWLVRSRPLPLAAILSLLLAVNVFGIISFAPLAVAVHLRSENLYMGLQFAFLFWMMGVTTKGLRDLTGISLPRCFMSLLLSFAVTILALFSMYLIGAIPPDLLKASMAI